MNSTLRRVVTCWIVLAAGIEVYGGIETFDANDVLVDSWRVRTAAADYIDGPGLMAAVEEAVTFPFDLSRTVVAGQSQSTTVYDFDATADGLVFNFDFSHVRDGDEIFPYYDFAGSSGTIGFTVSEPARYLITGSYQLEGSNRVGMRLELIGPNQSLVFRNTQRSTHVQDQYFLVGGMDGEVNDLVGTPTGVLMPGLSYSFSYYYSISTEYNDSGASAFGDLTFQIVPEPSLAGAMMVALFWGCSVQRRRRPPQA